MLKSTLSQLNKCSNTTETKTESPQLLLQIIYCRTYFMLLPTHSRW